MKKSINLILFCLVFLSIAACQITPTPADINEPSSNVYSQSDYLNRDVRDDIFYFVMPDRFNNGDASNDQGSDEHAISNGGLDVTSKWAFHGGDIRGLEQKLDYLKGMGITAIWMTPILRNKAVQRHHYESHSRCN